MTLKLGSFIKKLDSKGKLPIRVFLTIYYEELNKEETPPSKTINSSLLSIRRLKLLSDGSLGAETAGLRKNYRCSHNHGVLIYEKSKLEEAVKKSHQQNYQLEVHAIGDLAAEHTINSFIKANINASHRPVLTHCQVLGKDLIELMKKYGVIANVQPQFVTTDSLWAEKRLPDELLAYSYIWKTLMKSGITVVGGSDAPIEDCNPLLGLYCAIFRLDHNGKSWKPEECLTFHEAMQIYTSNAAYATWRENDLGKLLPGFQADFIVLDKNIEQQPYNLPSTNVEEVWVNGKLKHIHLQAKL